MESPENSSSATGTIVIYGRNDAPGPELKLSPNILPPAPSPPTMEGYSAPVWMRHAYIQEDPSPAQTPLTPLTRAEAQRIHFNEFLELDSYERLTAVLFALFLFITMVAEYITEVVLLSFQYVWTFLKVTYWLWSYGPAWPLKILCQTFFWGAFVPAASGIIMFSFTYLAEYGLSEGPVQIYREISKQGMEYHMYFATLRVNFLDAMERVDLSMSGWVYYLVHRIIKVFFVRSLEVAADVCLAGYGIFLRSFFARCASEEMDGTRAWWFVEDSLFTWDQLRYWFLGEPGTGFCWINRRCPGMNWAWWNQVAFHAFQGIFEGVWGVNGVVWEALSKPFRWWWKVLGGTM